MTKPIKLIYSSTYSKGIAQDTYDIPLPIYSSNCDTVKGFQCNLANI